MANSSQQPRLCLPVPECAGAPGGAERTLRQFVSIRSALLPVAVACTTKKSVSPSSVLSDCRRRSSSSVPGPVCPVFPGTTARRMASTPIPPGSGNPFAALSRGACRRAVPSGQHGASTFQRGIITSCRTQGRGITPYSCQNGLLASASASAKLTPISFSRWPSRSAMRWRDR